MKKNALISVATLTLALSLTACGGEVITKTTDSLDQQGQTSASDSEAPDLERPVTGAMLLDGKETTVYLEVSDRLWAAAQTVGLNPDDGLSAAFSRPCVVLC